ncbi:MAG: FAD:protein FMN transferase, partial [Clostridia bacterium]|nr:FAD:protein FMN transferase [Clostridia bacterium]
FTVKAEGDGNEYSIALDVGGIAKGWCVDKVNVMLEEAGIEYGYFNFGESSMSVKKFFGGDSNYSVAANDPRATGGVYVSFKMQNANLSTSGDNHKYYEIDGTRYCHIIDPRTGSPIQTGVATVTIVGGPAGRSDALTTALSAMDMQGAADFINENMSESKVIMLFIENGSGKVLTNAPDYFKIENKNYVLANTVENGKIVLN